MEACLHSLLASLQRERTERGVCLLLRLLLCVRVRPTHLARLPLAREVRRLSRQDASTRGVRELATACEERWRDLTKLGPAGEEQRVHRSGKRGRSCRQLYASLSAVSHDDELVNALEELLYNKAASSHGRSAEKLERYIELVDSSCSALASSPLLQALLATRCLSLEALAAPPLPDAEEWLCRALRGHASEEGGPVTRGTLAANSRPTPQLRRQLLEDIARKRRRRTLEEQPVPNPVQTALPPLPCGASAVRMLTRDSWILPIRGRWMVGSWLLGRRRAEGEVESEVGCGWREGRGRRETGGRGRDGGGHPLTISRTLVSCSTFLSSQVSLVLASFEPREWCRLSAVCREWAACAKDGSLWAAAYQRRWPEDTQMPSGITRCSRLIPRSSSVPYHVAPASPFFSWTPLDSFPPISTPAHPLSRHRTLRGTPYPTLSISSHHRGSSASPHSFLHAIRIPSSSYAIITRQIPIMHPRMRSSCALVSAQRISRTLVASIHPSFTLPSHSHSLALLSAACFLPLFS